MDRDRATLASVPSTTRPQEVGSTMAAQQAVVNDTGEHNPDILGHHQLYPPMGALVSYSFQPILASLHNTDVAQQGSASANMPFLSMTIVYPYLYPAYGLARLANELSIAVKVQEWNQTIRAAVVLTALVEDLVSPELFQFT